MDPQILEASNPHGLERKLSLVLMSSLAYTAQSHGSVVHDPNHLGLAKTNVQLSVLQYIKDSKSEFDSDKVFDDRQQKFATSFAREYTPAHTITDPGDKPKEVVGLNADGDGGYASEDCQDCLVEDFESKFEFENDRHVFGHDLEDSNDDSILLPLLPPRLPPREMDPSKLYGLFDFLGPDPLHCTLHRDEPVCLLNDLDNYWWLIRKLKKSERKVMWLDRGSTEEVFSDAEDGKIGFVPAECLETYGERLARLNCFKNEELERFSRDTLPQLVSVSNDSLEDAKSGSAEHLALASAGTLPICSTSSILKKSGSSGESGLSNKLVTFENLGDVRFDEEDEDDGNDDDDGDYSDDFMDFTNNYYSVGHEDLASGESHNLEKLSEVLSDIYPAEEPLQIRKARAGSGLEISGFKKFTGPKPRFSEDNVSICSSSPDTSRRDHFSGSLFHEGSDEDEGKLRRSVILDRLHIASPQVQIVESGDSDSNDDAGRNPTFGPCFSVHGPSDEGSDGSEYGTFFFDDMKRTSLLAEHVLDGEGLRKSLLAEEITTPLTSVNSLGCITGSPKAPASGSPKVSALGFDKRKTRPVYDMLMPILGQLDELTERLAELEHTL